MSFRRRPTRRPLALVAAAALLVAGGAVGGVPAGAQAPACAGVVVDATVSAPSVPGGAWSVVDACVPVDAVYEAELLGYRLVGGMGVASYQDGHVGRVAFLTAKVGDSESLTLIGVEDHAAGRITWAFAEGGYAESAGVRTVGGAAEAATIVADQAPGPVESAQVQLELTGSGTDLATASGPVADELRRVLDAAAAALTD
jgi:hypothetical protein